MRITNRELEIRTNVDSYEAVAINSSQKAAILGNVAIILAIINERVQISNDDCPIEVEIAQRLGIPDPWGLRASQELERIFSEGIELVSTQTIQEAGIARSAQANALSESSRLNQVSEN